MRTPLPELTFSRLAPLAAAALALFLSSCSGDKNTQAETTFTSADSITDRYLQFQDSMLHTWNLLVNDDTRKFRSMHKLLHEMMTTGNHDQEELIALEQRLNKLSGLSITQESIADATLVEEYDFTTSSLVTELLSLARSHESFAQNQTLHNMVQEIILIDQRVENNRRHYDAIADEYNRFLEDHLEQVIEIELGVPVKRKPLFEMAAEE